MNWLVQIPIDHFHSRSDKPQYTNINIFVDISQQISYHATSFYQITAGKTMTNKIKTTFAATDRKILTAHEDIVDGIAAFMGTHCEVVLHSLEDPDHAIVKIINGHHTNRKVGAPLTEQGTQILLDFHETGQQDHTCYTTSSAKGDPMRSLFTVVCNNNKPIGLLGINFNMNIPLTEFISSFSLFHQPALHKPDDIAEPGTNNVEDLIHSAVNNIVIEISGNVNIPNHEKNKYIVYGLNKKGIFDIKGSVAMVAKELKLSKYTIYGYIRESKENSK
jgi:predicted transcriptional regulator YheO